MQADTDRIGNKRLPQEREWAKADRRRLHVLETAVANETIELARIMPLRLKP
jgi:hypothetical protein